MTATYVEKIWTAKDIDHISSLEVALDKHAKMVKARDATIAHMERFQEQQYAAWRATLEREIAIGASVIAKRDATIAQLKAEAAKRAGA